MTGRTPGSELIDEFLDLFFRPLRNDNFTLMCAVVTRCEGTKTLTLKRIWILVSSYSHRFTNSHLL
jgi:hypothetical protein